MTAALTLALLLAPAQCWGPARLGPVGPARVLPLVAPQRDVVPDAEAKARRAQEAKARAKYAARLKAKAGGCACCAACECRADDCPCLTTGKLCQPGCKCVLLVGEGDNFGLDTEQLGKRARFTLSDSKGRRSVTRSTALAAIAKGAIPDESKLLRLTVIGPEAERKRVLADLDTHGALLPWKGKLLVQARPSDDPYLRDRGFVTAGSPSLYVQAPAGRVLGRNLDGAYRGPEALAAGLELAQKRYDPSKDPDLWAPKPAPVPEPSKPDGPTIPPAALWVGLGGLLVYLLWRSSK